jgi:hypothetical protein
MLLSLTQPTPPRQHEPIDVEDVRKKQLVCSESQSNPPQRQMSEPSIAAQISDMLQQSSTRI